MLARPMLLILPMPVLLMHCAAQQHSFSSTVSNKQPRKPSGRVCCSMSMVISQHTIFTIYIGSGSKPQSSATCNSRQRHHW